MISNQQLHWMKLFLGNSNRNMNCQNKRGRILFYEPKVNKKGLLDCRARSLMLAEFGGKGERRENRPDSNYVLNTRSSGKDKRDQIFNLKYFQNIKKQDLTPSLQICWRRYLIEFKSVSIPDVIDNSSFLNCSGYLFFFIFLSTTLSISKNSSFVNIPFEQVVLLSLTFWFSMAIIFIPFNSFNLK